VEEDTRGVSTCEYKPEYTCYKRAICGRLSNGLCGWTEQTEEPLLARCLAQFTGEEVTLKAGEREGPFLLENINLDSVSGLNFPEYPLATREGKPLTLRIGEVASNGCTITLTLTRIEGDRAVFLKKTDFNRPCPVCLAENTLIDTPQGQRRVQDIAVGMSVWTLDAMGNRVDGVVAKTSRVPVPATHRVVHIILSDGRTLFVSPGHPTIDHRIVGDLAAGDAYDGSRVVSVAMVSYGRAATYDILPSGDTGAYWANGILLNSTLR
jgi:hypothetical protein